MKETRGSSLTRSVTYFTIFYYSSAVLVSVLFLYRLSFCLHLTQELEGTARKSAFIDGHPLSILSSNPSAIYGALDLKVIERGFSSHIWGSTIGLILSTGSISSW
jgi:hypothetical protein